MPPKEKKCKSQDIVEHLGGGDVKIGERKEQKMDKELKEKLGVSEDRPTDWFEVLYAGSDDSGEGVPWANMAPHAMFEAWLDDRSAPATNDKKALVVGCGMGDDAIALEAKGYEVTAFDVSESAIALCQKRFGKSNVTFVTADLIKGIPEWYKTFDFVLEIFTIQALPPKYESTLIKNIADMVADSGQLVMIAEVQANKRAYENGPPWPLNDDYIRSFESCGLTLSSQTTSHDTEVGDEIHLSVFER